MGRILLQCPQTGRSVPRVLHDELWVHWELDPLFKLVPNARSKM